MTDELLALLAVAGYALIGILIHRAIRRKREPEERTDFAYLTVREQLAAAQKTSDGIGHMEQLQTDLALSDPDDLLAVHLEWIGRDGTVHGYDVLCSGIDTASECLTEIAARESHMLHGTLARQCAALANGTRSTQNGAQNDEDSEGEWDYDEIVQRLRH